MDRSFGRDKRLLKPRQFKAVFDSPSGRVPGKNLLILIRHNDLAQARLGLVIGKKSIKLAVERNRIKRLLREAFRQQQSLLAGLDLVIVARKGLADADNAELGEHFTKLFKRAARKHANAAAPSANEAGSSDA